MPTFDDAVDHGRTSASSDSASDGTGRDVDDLATRLAAVERALSDGDTPVAHLEDADALEQRLTAVETAVEDLTDRVAELEAASDALRGYAAGVRAVNEDVERRADLALAKAETIEHSLREDPGLRVERLDESIRDGHAANTAEGPATDAAEQAPTETADGPPSVDTEDRHAGESEPGHASDTEVAAAVGTSSETDDAPSGDSPCRSLSSRLRDAL